MDPKWYTFLGKCIYYSVRGRKLTELKKIKKVLKVLYFLRKMVYNKDIEVRDNQIKTKEMLDMGYMKTVRSFLNKNQVEFETRTGILYIDCVVFTAGDKKVFVERYSAEKGSKYEVEVFVSGSHKHEDFRCYKTQKEVVEFLARYIG